jgi:hypothetical protein
VNREKTLLVDPDGNEIGGIFAIDVSSGSIIAGGWYSEDTEAQYKPVIWVNGKKQILSQIDSDSSGIVRDIKYCNGNIFISGGTDSTREGKDYRVACYWLNGIRTDISGLTSIIDRSQPEMHMRKPDSLTGALQLDDPDIAGGIFITE